MRLLKQNGPLCLLYSAAMVFDVEVDELIKIIGHDGTEFLKDADEIKNFHIQEIVEAGLELGIALVEIGKYPATVYNDKIIPTWAEEEAVERFKNHIKGRPGIVVHDNHVCAWDGELVFNPSGQIGPMNIEACNLFYAAYKISR